MRLQIRRRGIKLSPLSALRFNFNRSPLPLFVLICSLSLPQARAEAPSDALSDLKSKIENLRSELSKERREQKKYEQKLKQIEKKSALAWHKLRETQAELKETESVLTTLRENRKSQVKAAQEIQNRIEAYLVATYQSQLPSPWQLLIGESNPSDVGRFLTYYSSFHTQELEQIEQLHQSLIKIDATEKEILATAENLNRLKAQRQSDVDQWQQHKEKRAAFLVQMNRSVADKSELLKQWQAEKQLLLDEVAKTPSAMADGVSFASLRGKLAWPVEGKLSSRFGSVRLSGGEAWQGVLIEAPEGADVRAIYAGKVVYADWLRGLGLLIIVDHGGNYLSLYGHNAGLLKGEGDWVQKGELLASVGDSGGIKSPALYFEIRQGAKPLNPQQWCQVKAKI
ncbi:MAG TPA: hypothetical protein DCZ03_09610 [Gammaproteobacteria bacterium]|nr:hypothetical protein [Gammaproteobacteria bacterium]